MPWTDWCAGVVEGAADGDALGLAVARATDGFESVARNVHTRVIASTMSPLGTPQRGLRMTSTMTRSHAVSRSIAMACLHRIPGRSHAVMLGGSGVKVSETVCWWAQPDSNR